MVSAVQSDEILGDRYRIVTVLGNNPCGATYLVHDVTQRDRPHILREFHLPSQDPDVVQQARDLFAPEVEFLRRLHHPQLPQVQDFFELTREGTTAFYLVQTFVEGTLLRHVLERRWDEQRPLTELEGIRLLQQLLPVVDYLHTQGVIHRNISPDTILWRPQDSRLVLINFGGIKQVLVTLWTDRQDMTTLTQAAALPAVGSVGYAPPEQIQKGIIYTYSDLYAVGTTVLMALTGQEPKTLLNKEGQWRWDDIVLHNAVLKDLLATMVARKTSDRPQSAHAVLQSLPKAVKAMPPTPLPQSEFTAAPEVTARSLTVPPVGRWLGRGLLVLLVVAGAGGMGWLLGQAWVEYQVSRPAPPQPDLDLSPTLPPILPGSELLSFPPTDDPEPEPDADLPSQERDRMIDLRRQRQDLTIDYDFFQGLLRYKYEQKYPSRVGTVPTPDPDDEIWRNHRYTLAQQLLDTLSELSGEARRRLGQYDSGDRRVWRQQLQDLNLSFAVVELLTDSVFALYFPLSSPDDAEPLQQVWDAIAFDHVKTLTQGDNLIPLTPQLGEELRHGDSLEAWQGVVFTVEVTAGQFMQVNAVSDYPTVVGVYGPTGEPLLERETERVWSGTVQTTGTYAIAIASNAPQLVNYNLYLTLRSAP
jgi:serine/threonine-protein kinase